MTLGLAPHAWHHVPRTLCLLTWCTHHLTAALLWPWRPISANMQLDTAVSAPCEDPLLGAVWLSAGAARRMQAEDAQVQACTFAPSQQRPRPVSSPRRLKHMRGRLHEQLPLQKQVTLTKAALLHQQLHPVPD